MAYEEARDSDSIWAHAAERLAIDKSPDGILKQLSRRCESQGYEFVESEYEKEKPPEGGFS
jgi:hypothetical protein